MADETVPVTVETEEGTQILAAKRGAVLRDVLLAADCSPYTRLTERANCGGRGICATCGVRVLIEDEPDQNTAEDSAGTDSDHSQGDDQQSTPAPEHWHDALADRFGYPRLSCQITVEEPIRVRIPEKLIWGDRSR